MAGLVRKLVASNKRRFVQDGFALDLSYISPRIIAMGLPAEGTEGLYRNPLSEIVRFLSTYHLGKAKVFNLCAERCYSPAKLMVPVLNFPFEDHQTPSLELISSFCAEATAWLRSAPDAVIVVHCKAGKGRTGIMVCCLLLSIAAGSDPGLANTAIGGPAWRPLDVNLGLGGDPVEDVLQLYASRRTHDGKGVTIASQRRYVRYFWDVLRRGGQLPQRRAVRLRRISFSGLPPSTADICALAVSYRPQGSPPCLPPSIFFFHGPARQGSGCLSPCVGGGGVGGGGGPRVEVGPGGDWLQVALPAGPEEQWASAAAGDAGAESVAGGGCYETEYVVEGDVRVQLLRNGTSLCYTWFNTAYLPSDGHYTLLRQKLDKVAVPSEALALSLTFEDAPLAAVSATRGPLPAQQTAGALGAAAQKQQGQAPAPAQQGNGQQAAPTHSKVAGSVLSSSNSLPGSVGASAAKGTMGSMWPWKGGFAAAAGQQLESKEGNGPWAKDAVCIELPVISAQSGESSMSEDDVVAAVMWSSVRRPSSQIARGAAGADAGTGATEGASQQPSTAAEQVAVDWRGCVVGGQSQQAETGKGSGCDWDDEPEPAVCGSPLSRLGSLLESLELGWNATPVTATPNMQRTRSAPVSPREVAARLRRPVGMGHRSLSSNAGQGRSSTDAGVRTPLLPSASVRASTAVDMIAAPPMTSSASMCAPVSMAAKMAAAQDSSSHSSAAADIAAPCATISSSAAATLIGCPSPTSNTSAIADPLTPCCSSTTAFADPLTPCCSSTTASASMAAAVAAAAAAADSIFGPFGGSSAPPSMCGTSLAAAAQSPISDRGVTSTTASSVNGVSSPLLMSHLSEPNPSTADLISFQEGSDAATAAATATEASKLNNFQAAAMLTGNVWKDAHVKLGSSSAAATPAPVPAAASTSAAPAPAPPAPASAGSAAVAALARAAAAGSGNKAAPAPAWRRASIGARPARLLVPHPLTPSDVLYPDQNSPQRRVLQGRSSMDAAPAAGGMSPVMPFGRHRGAARKLRASDSDLQALLPRRLQPQDQQQRQQQQQADAGAMWQQLDEAWSQRWWV